MTPRCTSLPIRMLAISLPNPVHSSNSSCVGISLTRNPSRGTRIFKPRIRSSTMRTASPLQPYEPNAAPILPLRFTTASDESKSHTGFTASPLMVANRTAAHRLPQSNRRRGQFRHLRGRTTRRARLRRYLRRCKSLLPCVPYYRRNSCRK